MVAEGVLRLLSSRKNQAILGLLTIEPSYPRRLGGILELPEADVARRLRRMKAAGLVTSEWAQVGQNVKLYRLTSDRFTLRIAPDGLELDLDDHDDEGSLKRSVARTEPAPEAFPAVENFVGRQRELDALGGPEPVVLVLGLPGIGKTSLISFHAAREEEQRAVFWCGFRGVESFNWLAHRLALFFAQQGDQRLLHALEENVETIGKWGLMLTSMDRSGHLFVFDDAHRIEDDEVLSFLEETTRRMETASVVVASREPVQVQPETGRVVTLRLEGLTDRDVAAFLEAQGMPSGQETLEVIQKEVGGHPLALNLLVGTAKARGVSIIDVLARTPGQDLEDYLLREVYDTLVDDERRVISLASLFRTRFTLEDLQSLTKRPINGPLLRLRRKLLMETRGAGYYLHETLRNFFHDHLTDRKRLHQKVAERYLESDTEEGRLEAMHHFLAAGRRDRVLELLEETNLDLREFENIDSGYHDLYLSVLNRFQEDEVADDRRWALMEDERGDILYHRGNLEGALGHYDEAMTYFRKQEDQVYLADLAWKRALTLSRLDRQEEAQEARKEGLQFAPEVGLARKRLESLAERTE